MLTIASAKWEPLGGIYTLPSKTELRRTGECLGYGRSSLLYLARGYPRYEVHGSIRTC